MKIRCPEGGGFPENSNRQGDRQKEEVEIEVCEKGQKELGEEKGLNACRDQK